jgi:hypothetical protein
MNAKSKAVPISKVGENYDSVLEDQFTFAKSRDEENK